jgi:hypothetical protein
MACYAILTAFVMQISFAKSLNLYSKWDINLGKVAFYLITPDQTGKMA